MGYVPYSLGYALGLPGLASLLPVGIAIGGAVILVLAPAFRRSPEISPGPLFALPVVMAVFAAYLVPVSFWPSHLSVTERQAIQLVKTNWAPVPLRARPPEQSQPPVAPIRIPKGKQAPVPVPERPDR